MLGFKKVVQELNCIHNPFLVDVLCLRKLVDNVSLTFLSILLSCERLNDGFTRRVISLLVLCLGRNHLSLCQNHFRVRLTLSCHLRLLDDLLLFLISRLCSAAKNFGLFSV
ncbi:Uncharacterised protein [Serratia marcescens]|nr:Uncharacterised protein [Serratia marcescens]CUZ36877.1 Uncharacterised protein [Serratia marcescens]CVB38231.1 Uncharacterised protein [Serratia marcescens]CVB47207.1 Uncharacterised protein [Serratia marcescens]CVD69543.1 Uncharacterised protein [Serratia marcescens]